MSTGRKLVFTALAAVSMWSPAALADPVADDGAGAQPLAEARMETDAVVWSGLFFAGSAADAQQKGEVPTELAAELVATMKQVEALHAEDYRLLGAATQDVLREYDSWVLPSDVFFIKLDSLGRAEDGALKAMLQVWQQKDVLMKASVSLRPGRPFFVRGPKWGDGHIVLALLLQDDRDAQ
ncbi:hypothetical protein [Sulfuriroseicoccus oceanibius]|uniref:Uncharacterized protein n=1 Tax=Sulfuriroseicoccus oceanibius TaxID=2707525 RepID=A0A6B3L2G4_9BACT|nr:hypothetical protein [Sulfuriroseicoccus oceanibius]QQL43890.1 hypothetical protein G3M56_008270 [Sulfuriroseicoccus oceanibius]